MDIIEEIEPIIMGKLDDGTWMHCEPRIFLEENNITENI